MVSFFGLAATLDPTTTLAVFVGLVICLILFEHALDEIEVLAEEAGYKELVKKVYKEMMIMGFLGFGVFMAFNVFTLEHDENFLAFEFVHLTVFFIGIILVLRALLAIYNSSRSTQLNWTAQNASIESILDRIDATHTSWSFESFAYKYFNIFSPLQHTINYKMLEDYFHKDFNISRVEFRFVDYLSKHNIFYAMELTEVSLFSWLAVIIVVILNFIRILSYDNGLHDCTTAGDDHHDDHALDDHAVDDHALDDHHVWGARALSGTDDGAEFHLSKACADFGAQYFLFCGGLLIVFGFFVCFANYWSERKVAITGDYWTYAQQQSRLKQLRGEEQGRAGSQRVLVEISEEVWHVCSLRKVLEEKKIEEYHRHISKERNVREFFNAATGVCWKNKAASRVQTVEAIKDLKNANKSKLRKQDSQSSLKTRVVRAGAVGDEKDEHPLLFEYDEPLFFKNRKAHKFLIECFQMLMALYIAMWATNYVFVSQHSSHFGAYLTLTLLQILAMLVEMSYLQDTACSLLAVTSLVNEAAEMMCEEDHIKAKVLPKIRQEIEELTPEGTSLEKHLFDIYQFVNFDGDDNGIGLKEFSSLLFTVDLILPDNEVDILFRAVDSNGSGNIEFEELFELFRPDSRLQSKHVEDGDTSRMKQLTHQASMASGGPTPHHHHHHHTSKEKPHREAHKHKAHTIVPVLNEDDGFADIENVGGEEEAKVEEEEEASAKAGANVDLEAGRVNQQGGQQQ